jgi:5'-deoxynucleotidase
VVTRALFHDATEAITGDLPTPVKYSPAMRQATVHLEDEVSREMIALLPEALQDSVQSALDHRLWPADEAELVKAADRLSAWLKCLAELRYGNREFEQAAQQIEAKLHEHMLPEVRYFLDTFGPAYNLTLDSLMRGD